jgi:N-acetyl-S-(2-succino)cysteine monooxygenase
MVTQETSFYRLTGTAPLMHGAPVKRQGMNGRTRQIKLGAFLTATGQHVAAWRHSDVLADGGVNLPHYIELVRSAECAKFDMMFLADNAGVWQRDLDTHGLSSRVGYFEPITLLSALASVTKHIGLVATMTTTFNEPFNVARKYASLDHLSGGRAGWNLVTSANEAEAFNFGYDQHLPHAERYARAREFAHIVLGLWDSWEDDAFLRDKESGVFYDPTKLHILNYEGAYFKVRGPLNVPRSPQGHPVVVQAGSSDTGMDLAAETAEVVFTAQATLGDAQAFYADLKGRLPRYDRAADDLKIMPGLSPVVAASEQEAIDKYEALQKLIHPSVALSLLSAMLGGFDLKGHDPEGPLPDLPESNTGKGRQKVILDAARRDNLSIREIAMRVAGARGHHIVVGTPKMVADRMEEWFAGGAADGFNIMPQSLPGALDDFNTMVIPELQKRGLFRTEYEGRSLRENLGLPHPPNRFAAKTRTAAE